MRDGHEMIRHRSIGIAVFVLLLWIMPVAADLLESTYQGKVVTADPMAGVLTVKPSSRLGMEYNGTTPVTVWVTIASAEQFPISGVVPDAAVFSLVKEGDVVRVTNIGGAGGPWVSIAGIATPGTKDPPVAWLVGETRPFVAPLYQGGYRLETLTLPDCSSCKGTTCNGTKAEVTLEKEGKLIASRVLSTGEEYRWSSKEPGDFDLAVKFLRGEALSSPCGGETTTGPQAISVFTVISTPSRIVSVSPTPGFEVPMPRISITTGVSSASAGETVILHGICEGVNTSEVYLLITGPGLDPMGVPLNRTKTMVSGEAFSTAPLNGTSWIYAWKTSWSNSSEASVLEKMLAPGNYPAYTTYSVYVLSAPVNLSALGDSKVVHAKIDIDLRAYEGTPSSTQTVLPQKKFPPTISVPGPGLPWVLFAVFGALLLRHRRIG